jgi:cytochrome c-type biogenesis protein
MDALFTALSDALSASYPVAMLGAFGWGVLSILLSPCHLSSIPLIVGFLTAQGEKSPSRNTLLSLSFGVGILLTIGAVGAITAALGRMMGDVGSYGKYAIAAVFFVVGMYLMDVIRLPDLGIQLRPFRNRSVFLSAFALGLMFGIALGPCTFAFMAPVLSVVFQISETNLMGAIALLIAFGVGHCGVIVLAGGATARVQQYLDWTNRSNVIVWMKRTSGFLLVLAGVYAFITS